MNTPFRYCTLSCPEGWDNQGSTVTNCGHKCMHHAMAVIVLVCVQVGDNSIDLPDANVLIQVRTLNTTYDH